MGVSCKFSLKQIHCHMFCHWFCHIFFFEARQYRRTRGRGLRGSPAEDPDRRPKYGAEGVAARNHQVAAANHRLPDGPSWKSAAENWAQIQLYNELLPSGFSFSAEIWKIRDEQACVTHADTSCDSVITVITVIMLWFSWAEDGWSMDSFHIFHQTCECPGMVHCVALGFPGTWSATWYARKSQSLSTGNWFFPSAMVRFRKSLHLGMRGLRSAARGTVALPVPRSGAFGISAPTHRVTGWKLRNP